MHKFSISQLQQFSGIKAHTIRIWEQRYNALQPQRSGGNTRYYDNHQLRRLLNIVSLIDSGYKVSELCGMPDNELFEIIELELKNINDPCEHSQYLVSQFIAAGMCYDEASFEKLFSNSIKLFGLRQTYLTIIQPMLVRIGLMWSANAIPPEQEHFITNLLRQKLFSHINTLPINEVSVDSWLLFLPENEFHEISLLFSYYIIRTAGVKVTYLGSNTPLETLINAVKEINPTHLLLFFVHNDIPEHAQGYLDTLAKRFKKIKFHVSGNELLLSQLKIGQGINWLHSVEDLELQLK